MGTASRDANRIPTLLCALNTDGTTPVAVQVTSINRISTKDATTGTDKGIAQAERDNNRVPVLTGVSATDGKTIVEVYADSTGAILVRST